MIKSIFSACLILMFGTLAFASTTINYTLDSPMIGESNAYTTVKLNSAQTWGEPGAPELPWFGIKILLPVGNEATDIVIKRSNPTTYKLNKPVQPLQKQYPLSHPVLEVPTTPNPEIYSSDAAFPQLTHNSLRTEFLAGHPIAFTAVSPFEYNPVQNTLVFYQNLNVDVSYSPSSRASAALNLLKNDPFTLQRLARSIERHTGQFCYC